MVKVLVDADFLVTSQKNSNRLFSLINSSRQLEITIVSESLMDACQSREVDFDKLCSSLPKNGIRIISRKDIVGEHKRQGLLAHLDKAQEYTEDFYSQVEIAYALSLNISNILTDNERHFIQLELNTPFKTLSIDRLEKYIGKKTEQTPIEYIKNIILKWRFYLLVFGLFIITLLIILFTRQPQEEPIVSPSLSSSYVCPLVGTSPYISCGENRLYGDKNKESSKDNPITAFRQVNKDNATSEDYQDIVEKFKKAWNENKDPETLIYLNNALLEANIKDAHTIAVMVPLQIVQESDPRKSVNTDIDPDNDLGGEILRGVAHVQTLVNSCLLDDQFSFLTKNYLRNPIPDLCPTVKRREKGLRVLIADDANTADRAKELAPQLNELKLNDQSIIAVIGHYASDVTSEVIDIYNQKKLVLISSGSTSESDKFLQDDDYFFRTVPGVSFHADKLIEYMKKKKYTKPAIFYNESSDFSDSMYHKFREKIQEQNKNNNPEAAKKIDDNPLVFVGNKEDKSSFAGKEFKEGDAIEKIKDQKADVIVLFPDGQTSKSMTNAVKIMRKNMGNIPILGTWTLRNSRFSEKTDPDFVTDEKLVAYSPYDFSETDNTKYVEQAQELWGDAYSPITAITYDAAWVLVKTILEIETSNLNRNTLKNSLQELKKVENGATGDIYFYDDGNGNRKELSGFLVKLKAKNNQNPSDLIFVPIDNN